MVCSHHLCAAARAKPFAGALHGFGIALLTLYVNVHIHER